jgi:adenylate cyclase
MDDGFPISQDGVAEPGEGVVESRSGRPRGDLEEFDVLHEGQPEVVMQDEHRPLFDGEPAECPLHFVAVGEGRAPVRGRWPSHGQHPDLRRPVARPLRLVVAGMDEDSMDPRLETVGIPQLGYPTPGQDEGVVQRVLGKTAIAQDPLRHREQRVTDLVHQDCERLAIARSSPLDEVSIHLDPSETSRAWRPGLPTMTGRLKRNVQMGTKPTPKRPDACLTWRTGRTLPGVADSKHELDFRRVLTGEDAGLTKFRRAMRRIPSSPRCKLCAAPFTGPGGAILRHVGFGRFPGNPAMCTNCISDFRKHDVSGATIPLTLLFADIRGSTTIGERLSPADFRSFLNGFYTLASDAVLGHDGIVDKFVGDEVIGLFFGGVTGPAHASAAIGAALDLAERSARPDATPMGPIPVGAAVHTGEAWVGASGPAGAVDDFTALGDVVNTTARLTSEAATGEVVASVEAVEAAGLSIDPAQRRTVDVRGREGSIEIVQLRRSTATTG